MKFNRFANQARARKLRGSTCALALAAALGAAMIAPAAQAQVLEERVVVDAPAQPLSDALIALSAEAGLSIAFTEDQTAGVSAPALSGDYAVGEALDALLADSGLAYEVFDDRAVRIITIAAAVEAAAVGDAPETTPAPANTADAAATVPERETIFVYGYRSAFASSLETRRAANQVLDAITAEEIGQFPDQNIAEAIQRISGTSLTRNNGEGESVTIRGLDPRFTRIEIDGRTTAVTIDSANPERESVLSVFASDLYNEIQVIKSPTAADVEGGVGGIVRLNTPNPLEVGELRWGLDLAFTDADLRDDIEDSLNGFYSNAFADGRVGVLFSFSYENLDRRIDKIQANQDWVEVDEGFLADDTNPNLLALVGGRFPGRFRQEQRTGERERLNLSGRLHFEATPDLELYLNGLYTSDDREEDRARIQIQWQRGQLEGGVLDAATGTLTSAEFTRQRTEFRDFTRVADIETMGLSAGFEWTPGLWDISAEASYSSSEENFDETRADVRINRDGLGGYDISSDPRYPSIFTEGATLALEDVDLRSLQFQRRIIQLEETSFELDAERFVDWGLLSSFEAGVRYADAEFDRRQGAVSSSPDLTYADGDSSFVLDGSFGQGFGDNLLTSWPSVDPVTLYAAYPSDEPFSFNDEDIFNITEEVTAAYAMANFDAPMGGLSVRGNAGARVVQTEVAGTGRLDIDVEDDLLGDFEVLIDDTPTLAQDYTEVLPAFNLAIGDDDAGWLVRGAITRALSRPELERIRPNENVTTIVTRDAADQIIGVDGTISRGNPNLEPFLAWQYDLGLEYYFGENGEGGFSISVFYKDIENFNVADEFDEVRTFDVMTPGGEVLTLADGLYTVETYRNGGEASIGGLEMSFQTPFTFLPDSWPTFLQDFGVFANYTYTDSEFTDENGNTFTFPGASEHTYNIVGYYERGGFSSRLAYNYRDDYLVVPSSAADGSNTVYGEEQGRLDFALRYRFDNGLRVSFDALNLTEENQYLYYDDVSRLEDLEFEGRIYTIGVGYVY